MTEPVHKTTVSPCKLEGLRRVEYAAQQLIADVMKKHGIADRDGFTCPKMRALYEAIINA